MPEEPKQLTLENLRKAVRAAAAFRLRVKLHGAGGDGDKVFPPTYAGGVYAVEDRKIDGKVVRCALLDSVQSQANRMEEELLDAFLPNWRELNPDDGKPVSCNLPLLGLYVGKHGWVTSLTAPHRIHDAIIRDSEIEEETNGQKQRKRFRESTVGGEIVAARLHSATALYKHCPTALIFGTWDSTAGEGLDSAKIPRAVVSEIIGVEITPGVRTASRIDPLGIRAQSATVYRLKDREHDWTLDKSQAALKSGDPMPFGEGKPSDINHGNVTPDMPRFEQQEIRRQNLGRLPDILEATPLELRYELNSDAGRIESHGLFRSDDVRIRPGAVKPGGITMGYALHTWTLSLTQLRRLRFPVQENPEGQTADNMPTEQQGNKGGEATKDHRDEAARTVLAALALHTLALQQERGYWLRSRCELVSDGSVALEQIGGSGGEFYLGTAQTTRTILDEAIGLTWSKSVIRLTPTEKLQQLVQASDARGPAAEEPEEEETADAGAAG
ncbi:MAG: type I-G CRISPR-associated RAMP protein Csb1/Cas7g [Acidobacteriota bacterium]